MVSARAFHPRPNPRPRPGGILTRMANFRPRPLLASAALACAAAALAQQHTTLFRTDPQSCFAMSDPGRSGATSAVVPAYGMPFSWAWHITTPPYTGNSWDIRIRCFNTLPAAAGDTVLATFWMRTTAPAGGTGYTTFVVEKGAAPWTKSAEWTTGAGPEWKKIEIPFNMAESYTNDPAKGPADTYNISFWVTFDPQEIEIGGLAVEDYGQGVAFQDLNLTNWPYEGHVPDAPWRKSAADRIEAIRKADIVVTVKDDYGNPIRDADVRLKMKRHAFGWGSAVAGSWLKDPVPPEKAADTERYRAEILKLFNKAVLENDLKWPFWDLTNAASCGEGWGHATAVPALDWLRSNGITDIRGHNLIWPGKPNLPCDVRTMLNQVPVNQDALRTRIRDHFSEIMNATRGKLTEWDVINEPFSNKDVQAALGDDEMTVWFQWARGLDPTVKLFVNDYNILEAGGYDLRHQNGIYGIVQRILDQGGPVDGIGLQSHFNMNLTPPDRLWEILERFAALGRDLEITEFDVNITDQQTQADYTRDFMTLTFSHPAVKGFLMWGFWAGAHWAPNAAMLTKDWQPKPNYAVWNDLIYKQWWTDVAGRTDAAGAFRARGFLGDYDVEINGKTAPLAVTAGAPNSLEQKLPAFTAAGVVNTASYAKGAVAPGELVEVWGAGYGPPTLTFGWYEGDQLMTAVADVRLYFDGVPAPLIHTLPGRVAGVVPYAVSGTTSITVEYQGVKTVSLPMPVVAAIPGIFADDMTGAGQAAAATYDDNGAIAGRNGPANPVRRGNFISLYITGEGRTTPAVVEGRLTAEPYPKPELPVTVAFGDKQSNPQDLWVGLVYAGVTQINARVPADAPAGPAVPVTVTVGGIPAQSGVTVAIK